MQMDPLIIGVGPTGLADDLAVGRSARVGSGLNEQRRVNEQQSGTLKWTEPTAPAYASV